MPSPRPRILFFNPVRHALAKFEALSKVAQVEVVSSTSREEFFRDVGTKYNNIQAIYRTSASGAVSPDTRPYVSEKTRVSLNGNRWLAILTKSSSGGFPRR